MKLNNIKTIVLIIMENVPESRANDDYLYKLVISRLLMEQHIDIRSVTFLQFFDKRRFLGLPSFDSVSRVRRKIQEERSDLRADAIAERYKAELMEEYIEFAKG